MSRRKEGSRFGQARTAALALVAWILPVAGLLAQAAPDLTYRRVYVPEEDVDSQVRGLLPLRRDEFERRLAQVQSANDPLASQAIVRLETTTWRARLVEDELQDGTAELQFASSAKGAVLAPLVPCSPVLESAAWQGATDRPAVVGVDPAGRLQCLVEQSGTLRLDWSLRDTRAKSGVLTFDLQFPPAPRTRLEIDVPAELVLVASEGIVAAGPAEEGTRPWTVELSGAAKTRLEVRAEAEPSDERPLIVARETSHYAILRSAIDLETTLSLDVLERPVGQLQLVVERPFEVTSISLGEQRLGWSLARGADDMQSLVSIELPAELSGIHRLLRITATANWPGGEPWTLPRLWLEGVVLQEGEATLTAPKWLRVQARPLHGCRQTAVASATSGQGGANLDQFRFQLFDDARIEIAAAPAAAALREVSGTQIQIDAAQISGVLIAELATLGGETFSVDALVPKHWIIDAVETQPADLLAERTLVPRGAGDQRLRLALNRPLTEGRPLRVVVRGHTRRPAGNQPLASGFFRLASFPAAAGARRLVSVGVSDPGVELRLPRAERITRLDPQELSAAELRLFESPPAALLYEAGLASDGPHLTLVPAAARYRIATLVQVLVERESLKQSATIVCQPESSAVQTLLVRLRPRPPGAVAWQIVGEDPRELEWEELTSPEESGRQPGDAGLYRLTLQRPRTRAFEIRGQWLADRSHASAASLVWLPEAVAQTAMAEVHAVDGAPLALEVNDMQPLPVAASAGDRLTTLRARYRYEGSGRASLHAGTHIQHLARAWIETLHVTSRFSIDGQGDHQAKLSVQNTGARELALRLPPAVQNVRIVKGDGDGGTPITRGNSGELLVPLPEARRTAEIRLRYISRGSSSPFSPMVRLAAPLPEADVPVLSRHWTVSLAPGLAPLEAEERFDDRTASPLESTAGNGNLIYAGWTTLELHSPAGGHGAIGAYRPAVIRSWALCLALVGIAAGLSGRPAWSVPLTGLLAATALVSPSPLAWLIGGASAGSLVGALALLVRPRPAAVRSEASYAQGLSSTALAATPAATVVLCWSWLSASLLGQVVEGEGARPRVVFPVDADQKPAGDYVYLDPAFYEALHKLGDRGPTALPAWLLEAARYELPASIGLDAGAPIIGELRAQFDFHTFHPAATIRLPLARDQILLLEGRARLDGQPVTLTWEPDGAALTLVAESPGRHRLELACGAHLAADEGAASLALSIPSAARAVAVVPSAAPAVEITAAGASRLDRIADGRAVLMGTTSKLAARWPLPGSGNARASMTVADQLLWWKIRPGSVVVEGRFRVRPVGGAVREVTLAVDPRLRLAPSAADAPLGRVTAIEGMPARVRVDLAEPASSEFELRLTWLWPETSGAGSLFLPRVELEADRVARSWTAVSVGSGLALASGNRAGHAAIDPVEFVKVWGEGATAPSVAWDQSGIVREQPVLVRPAEASPGAVQTVEWSLGAVVATAHYAAQLSAAPPDRFEHRLTMSPQLKATRVELLQHGNPAAIRWSQRADGQLAVTLLEPPATDQQLNVVAELRLARQRPRFPLPAVRLEGASPASTTMRLYRRGDVQVRLQSAAGWTREEDPAIGRHREGLGRLVAALRNDAAIGDAQPVVNRLPNDPELSGTMLIQAIEEDGAWEARVDLLVDVRGGVLDEVRLSIPDSWPAPLSIEPAVESRFISVPGGRQLVVRPQQAASDKLTLSLRGPLTSGLAGIRVPDVKWLDEPEVERLVLLDDRAGGERIVWETTGLQATERSAAGSLPTEWPSLEGEWFRVVAPRFDAVARSRPSAQHVAHVHFADVQVALQPRGRLAGTATFVLEPAGNRPLTLVMPPGCRLVQALFDGVPAQAAPSGLRTWTVSSLSEQLPVVATVVFDGVCLPNAEGKWLLRPPQLSGLRGCDVCWTIEGAAGKRLNAAPQMAGTFEELELRRLKSAARGLEATAAASDDDLPHDALEGAQRHWRRAFDAALAELRGIQKEGGLSRDASIRIRRSEATASDAEQRLVQAGVVEEPAADVPAAAIGAAPPRDALFAITTAASPELVLTQRREGSAAGSGRWLLALAVAAGSLAAWPVGRLAAVRSWLASHGHLLLALAGVAWWILIPSAAIGWAGWLAVLTAAWLAMRPPWRTRTLEMD